MSDRDFDLMIGGDRFVVTIKERLVERVIGLRKLSALLALCYSYGERVEALEAQPHDGVAEKIADAVVLCKDAQKSTLARIVPFAEMVIENSEPRGIVRVLEQASEVHRFEAAVHLVMMVRQVHGIDAVTLGKSARPSGAERPGGREELQAATAAKAPSGKTEPQSVIDSPSNALPSSAGASVPRSRIEIESLRPQLK